MASNINVVAGGVYSMPPGYYLDDITITTPTLSSLTQATAGVADIRKGKTAWVNGKKIVGANTGTDGAIFLQGPDYLCKTTQYEYMTREGYKYKLKSNTISTNVVCNVNTNRLLIMIGDYIPPAGTISRSNCWGEMKIIDTAWAATLGPYNLKYNTTVSGSGSSAVRCNYGPRISIKSTKGGKFSVIFEGWADNLNYINMGSVFSTSAYPVVLVMQYKQ